jgi:SfnB family sulfur acquisition oxidoreductase
VSGTVSSRAEQHAPPAGVAVLASGGEALAAAEAYAAEIRPDAIARDREARLPFAELEELARTGLLGIRVPRALGGAEVSNAVLTEVVRRIAVADPAIAQIPQNHWAFVETITRFGSDGQRAFFCAEFLRGARLGNALAERGGKTARDWTTRLTRRADGTLRLDGRKYYTTGALTAQWIPVFCRDEGGEVVAVYVPRGAPGVDVHQDWTAFGQRATFSGTTVLDGVPVDPAWVIRRPLAQPEPTTFAAFGQIIHAAIDAGIARGALQDGATFLRERARPWSEAGVDRAADDPQIVRLAGELETQVRAAEALLVAAAVALDVADAAPAGAGADAITEARLAVAAAKAFAGEVALRVATEIFDFSGASAADSAHGLDRHWRNARTHTLHDPARSKHLHLGRWAIDGVGPAADQVLI